MKVRTTNLKKFIFGHIIKFDKTTLNKDNENDIKKYTELTKKTTKIKKVFIDVLIKPTALQTKLNSIEK